MGRIVQASRPAEGSVIRRVSRLVDEAGAQLGSYRACRTCAVLWEVLDSMVIGGGGAGELVVEGLEAENKLSYDAEKATGETVLGEHDRIRSCLRRGSFIIYTQLVVDSLYP